LEYGAYDSKEAKVDAVASILTTLYFACQRSAFPHWADEEREHIADGTLTQALERLLTDES